MRAGRATKGITALVATVVLVTACSTAAGAEMATGKATLGPAAGDAGAVAGREIDEFGLDLLRQLDGQGNLCFSPTSIALALAMVRPGARGTTAEEMDRVLHSFGTDDQAAEIVALLKVLRAQTVEKPIYNAPDWTPDPAHPGPGVELRIAHAAFAQKGMSLEQAYLDALSSRFGTGVGLLDYKTDWEAARAAINRWAAEQTHDRIPEVLQKGDITDDTRLALANAIYLNAGWTYPFRVSDTRQLPFLTAAGRTVSVPTMSSNEKLFYKAGPGYRAVELPLAFDFGSTMSVMIVLPDDMAAFVKQLSAAEITGLFADKREYEVDLALPRFKLNSRFDLAATLSAMGMPTIFSDDADLAGITPPTIERLKLKHVIHQAEIDVNERGTTASAVTVAAIVALSGAPRVTLHVDRPFLYFVLEKQSGAILFMGRVDDPSAS